MAAVETDKELNDLLDFTAVRSLLRLIEIIEYVVCLCNVMLLRKKIVVPF